jgi:excinuclease ABC subunit C
MNPEHPAEHTTDSASVDDAPAETAFARGRSYLLSQIKTLPLKPGVYRMFNEAGESLYVGKAKQLARRVTSYTQPNRLSNRLIQMVSETASLEITVTSTEVEALLLESNLIKKLKPRYNILLKDDKSFPHILLTSAHPYAQLAKHRGARTKKGAYFGPFASASAVNRTITTLSRAFMLRTCSDSYFSARSRPCLQYQIKRCTAPCVGYVSETDYRHQVDNAALFLSGQSDEVQREYAEMMQQASDELDFETAALWRNRIRALTAIQANQDINMQGLSDADIIALATVAGQSCVQVFFIRAGTNYGNTSFFPRHEASASAEEIISAFLGQFYAERHAPKLLLLSHLPEQAVLIADALSISAGHKIELSTPRRGARKQLMDMAERNALEALSRKLAESASQNRLMDALAEAFGLDETPSRIEIYDNSHIQGAHAVGGMVVADGQGFVKSAYRKFNMKDEGPHAVSQGDDFAMMRQMLYRRFERALKEDPERQLESWPDLLLIDGGKGQLSAAIEVMSQLGVDDIQLVAISKGPDRNAGREQFHMQDKDSFTLPPDSAAMHFLQRLRDEAHRFAIGSHRARRTKQAFTNPLDTIPGIGAKRKKALLAHFGSAKAVSTAGIRDLQAVEGISATTAQQIYHWFHEKQR